MHLTIAQARQALGLPPEGPASISIPEAGALAFGLSRNGSYDAADREELPTVRIGRLRKVPVVALAMRLLDQDGVAPEAVTPEAVVAAAKSAAQAEDEEATEEEARRREEDEKEEVDAETSASK